MKQEILFRAVGEVGDDLIARADRPVQKNKTVWLRWAAMAACCILVIGIAAFARVTLSGAKSAAPEANMQAVCADTAAPETPRSIEPETAMAEEKQRKTARSIRASLPMSLRRTTAPPRRQQRPLMRRAGCMLSVLTAGSTRRSRRTAWIFCRASGSAPWRKAMFLS